MDIAIVLSEIIDAINESSEENVYDNEEQFVADTCN